MNHMYFLKIKLRKKSQIFLNTIALSILKREVPAKLFEMIQIHTFQPYLNLLNYEKIAAYWATAGKSS